MSSAESAEAKVKNQAKDKTGGVGNTGTPITTQRAGPLPVMADCVAKVFLRHATQILRAMGATIE